MRGSEFKHYFEKISLVNPLFLKVTSIDEIPEEIKLKHFIICNLSPSNEPGSHWIVIVRSDYNTLEIFNSLGVSSLEDLKPYLKFKQQLELIFNEQPFQSKESTSCGFFCIYFSVQRILNFDMSFEHLLEDIFSANCEINEKKVVNFCSNLFNGDLNLFDD